MLELNLFTVIWISLTALSLYIAIILYNNLYNYPSEHQELMSKLPSMTKGFWEWIRVSFELAFLDPSEIMSFFLNGVKKFGSVYHMNLMGRSYVIVTDPKDLKIILSSSQHNTKGPEYDVMRPWLNDGLLMSSGSKWQTRRKMLTNTFHFKTLESYNSTINRHSRLLAKKLLQDSKTQKAINIKDYIVLCSLDVACQTIMGVDMQSQEGKSQNYVSATKKASKAMIDRIFTFWLWNDLIFKISKSGRVFYKSLKVLHSYTEKIIQEKRIILNKKDDEKEVKENSTKTSKNTSFLELLIKMSNEYPDQMTDEDIKEEVDTFLFEGHDTSSIAVTAILLLLGIHQDIQEEVRDELHSIFGDSDRDVTMEDLNKMTYLEIVIKEGLRIYPSVPTITRRLTEVLHLTNYSIPPNTIISIMPYVVHRDDELYPDPEAFKPKRFLDEENKTKFLFGYLPFSAGQRNCIGQKFAMQQIKIIISTIIRQLKFKTLGTREDIKITNELLIRFNSLPDMEFSAIY
ncbi:cytochrome P450 4V2-like [Adelges cooleyi]|uniref:cytochrome P450 4V2-like n=1 Tax=Adelges cooleyi TaxID=133065 RepID=UPI0021801BB8|nr:cytochrome P450 4V2-like [Adelges cooleyi]